MLIVASDGYGHGEMSEWFKEPVLKTGDSKEPWVRIPLSPPPFPIQVREQNIG